MAGAWRPHASFAMVQRAPGTGTTMGALAVTGKGRSYNEEDSSGNGVLWRKWRLASRRGPALPECGRRRRAGAAPCGVCPGKRCGHGTGTSRSAAGRRMSPFRSTGAIRFLVHPEPSAAGGWVEADHRGITAGAFFAPFLARQERSARASCKSGPARVSGVAVNGNLSGRQIASM